MKSPGRKRNLARFSFSFTEHVWQNNNVASKRQFFGRFMLPGDIIFSESIRIFGLVIFWLHYRTCPNIVGEGELFPYPGP